MEKLFDVFNSDGEFQMRASLVVLARVYRWKKEALARIVYETDKDNLNGCGMHEMGRGLIAVVHRATAPLGVEV